MIIRMIIIMIIITIINNDVNRVHLPSDVVKIFFSFKVPLISSSATV